MTLQFFDMYFVITTYKCISCLSILYKYIVPPFNNYLYVSLLVRLELLEPRDCILLIFRAPVTSTVFDIHTLCNIYL